MARLASYADIHFVALMHGFKRTDEALFEKLCAHDDAFLTLYTEYKPYLERDE
jgi:hypothetical protein